MPANLTPQYHKARARYQSASDPRERLEALEEMLRIIPKHKGTEHLQADIKSRIKETKGDLHKAKKRKRGGPSYSVESGGYPQVVLVGPPNSGKSSLVAALSGIELAIAPYPYTTHEPHPAMMLYENARIQLVDTPPISPDHMDPWLSSIARAGDAIVLVVDLEADDVLEGCQGVLDQLASHKLFLDEIPPEHEDSIGALLQPTLVALNKCDAPDADVALELFSEEYGGRFEALPVSAETGEALDPLRKRIWEMLDLVRAIPKPPGKPADYEDPILLRRGGTVVDMAREIHRELAETLKSARVWNSPNHADGQWVSRDHVVSDGEIIELDARH